MDNIAITLDTKTGVHGDTFCLAVVQEFEEETGHEDRFFRIYKNGFAMYFVDAMGDYVNSIGTIHTAMDVFVQVIDA